MELKQIKAIYRRALLEVISIANLWVYLGCDQCCFSRSLLWWFLRVPVCLLQSGIPGNLQDSLGWQSGRWRWWTLGGRWGRGKWWSVTIVLCQSKMAQPRMLTDMPKCMLACTIICLCPSPAELCQWWQGEPGSAGQPLKQQQRHRRWSLGCRLALSSAVPPSALCQATFRQLMHAPCHMMLAPMVSVCTYLLITNPLMDWVKLDIVTFKFGYQKTDSYTWLFQVNTHSVYVVTFFYTCCVNICLK
jgi:hypothetical protein